MTPPRLSRRALNRATLARQMLLRREPIATVAAIERLVGLQAQIPRPPFIGLWSRLDAFHRADLVRAIEARQVVRATMMRGTLHLMSRRDFLALRGAIQPILTRTTAAVLRDRVQGLDTDRLVAASRRYFEEEPRTFSELRTHLGKQFAGLDERAMGYLVRLHLPLIQTPAAGAPWAYPPVADFAVADSWLGKPLKADSDRPHTLALRYFAGFGPASVQDLQTWSGLASARTVVDELRPKLRTLQDEDGRELFDVPTVTYPDEDDEAPVRFLPEFDNLLLAYADRRRVIADEHKKHIFTKNLLVPATFLVDGVVAGKWSVERKKAMARLLLKPFGRIGRDAARALGAEGESLLRFVEPDAGSLAVEIGKPASN